MVSSEADALHSEQGVTDASVQSSSRLWWPGVLALAVIVLVPGLFFPQTASLTVSNWNSGIGAHGAGWLILALAAVVLWVRRDELLPKRFEVTGSALLTLIPAGAAVALALSLDRITVDAGASLLLASSLCVVAFGWRASAGLSGPAVVALFAMPLFAWSREPLSQVAAVVSDQVLPLLGVAVYRDGTLLHVGSGVFAVEKGCSGLNFLLTSACISLFACLMARSSLATILKHLALACAFAIAVNWLRIIVIVFIGDGYGLDHPIVADHLGFGWVLYSLLFLPYCYAVLPRPSAD